MILMTFFSDYISNRAIKRDLNIYIYSQVSFSDLIQKINTKSGH